jgi:hypothetical protein
MSLQAVLLPLFVEVALTFALMFWMGQLRSAALRSGEVHPRDIALRQPNWPAGALQVGYSFQNQFELPVLFYVLTILAWSTRHADWLFVILAWIFVLSRLAQAYIHCTSNRVPLRGMTYAVGAVALAVMWVVFAVRILLGLP